MNRLILLLALIAAPLAGCGSDADYPSDDHAGDDHAGDDHAGDDHAGDDHGASDSN